MSETHEKYALPLRLIHWGVGVLVIVLVPVGILMANRAERNIWDEVTNALYSWHKLIGFTVLLLVLVRIGLRLRFPAPAYPPVLPRWQVAAAHGLHGLLYVLLLAVPLLGWAGVTAYPALITVGGYHLPPMPFVPKGEALAARLFGMHKVAAIGLVILAVGHAGAALMHLLRRDGLFRRMWFDA